MYKNKKILALIPARGGSKGLPGKNIKMLLGKPLIAWTIEQAKACKLLDSVVVSTDDKDIARVALKHGASVPFLRPAELAQDNSAVSQAVLHTMDYFERQGQRFDILVLLEATSPLRYRRDISNIVAKLINSPKAGSVVGVVKLTNENPLWAFKLKDEYLTNFIERACAIKNFNRQLMDEAYLPYSIYATWWEQYKKYKLFYQKKTLPYFLKREQKIEIDDKFDLYLAECILKKYLRPAK